MRRQSPIREPSTADRGQTSIDFLIGVGLFLVTVAFVFGTIPGMIDPFQGSQEHTIVADRTASHLASGMLAVPGQPAKLNETCTYAFFDESYGTGDDCPIPFDETESDLATRLNLSSGYDLNVTIRRNVTGGPELDIVCRDGDAITACSGGLPQLSIGDTPSDQQSVTATRRTVFLDGKDAVLVVKVW